MSRTVAIWIFGLIGSGLAGVLISIAIVRPEGRDAGAIASMGFICGLCVFACARLLMTAPSSKGSRA